MSSTQRRPAGDRERTLHAYAAEGYCTVEGWGIDADLVRILLALDAAQAKAGISGNLLEIGVHHGRTFILLALMARPGESSFAIDLFDDQERNLDHSGEGNRSTFTANMHAHAPHATYTAVAGDSSSWTSSRRGSGTCGWPTSMVPTTSMPS